MSSAPQYISRESMGIPPRNGTFFLFHKVMVYLNGTFGLKIIWQQ